MDTAAETVFRTTAPNRRPIIYILLLLAFFALHLTGCYQQIAVGLTALLLLNFLHKLGREIVFIDVIALIASVQWLLGPYLFEVLGVRLGVPFDDYFALAVPSTLAFVFGMMFVTEVRVDQRKILANLSNQISAKLAGQAKIGLTLFFIGLPAWTLQSYCPRSIAFIVNLAAYLMYIGLIFLFFSQLRHKLLFFAAGSAVVIIFTFLQGMIGELIFWIFILLVMYSVKKPIKLFFLTKIVLFLIGLWVIAILQSSKTEYRKKTWIIEKNAFGREKTREIKASPGIFLDLIGERLVNPEKIFSLAASVNFATRLNQGMPISWAMRHVPAQEPFADGEVTLLSSVYAFIPRLFWPGKPEVTAADYFKKYTGVTLGTFTSVKLGALGDAYVDFHWGAIPFLLFLGGFIGWIYSYFFVKAAHNPLLILWMPVIMYSTMTITETSVAGYLNSLVKLTLFFYLVRLLISRWLDVKL